MAANDPDSGKELEKKEMKSDFQNPRSKIDLENLISKRPCYEDSNFPPLDQAGKISALQQQSSRDLLEIVTQVLNNENVISIQFADELLTSNFNNPIKLSDAINHSEFQKYIIENSLRVLGVGKAIGFEVNDISKIKPLNAIKTLGNWKVNYKQPSFCTNTRCS